MTQHQPKIFLFNIIPIYRHGMSHVLDYSRHEYGLASLPSAGQRTKQNTLFTSLENICGICLTDLDLFYNFATDGDSDYAKINWAGPGTFQLTQNGTITFTANSDFQGNGTDGYFSNGFIANTHAVSYTQDDASAFCAVVNDAQSSGAAFGCNGGGADPSLFFQPRNTSDVHQGRINNPTANTRGTSVSSQGFFQIQRTAAAVSKILKNGSQVGADITFGSVGLPATSLPILANNNNGNIQNFYPNKVSCFGLGASLSGQETALYNAWNTYFTSL